MIMIMIMIYNDNDNMTTNIKRSEGRRAITRHGAVLVLV